MSDVEKSPINVSIKVDSKDAVKVINKLIDTVKSPFERWMKNNCEVAIAEAETKAMLIRAKAAKPLAQALGLDEHDAVSLVLRSSERELYERLRQQKNLEAIATGAYRFLPLTLPEERVDEDWILEFFDQSKNTSNEYLQSIWSRILAGKIAKPGRYSKRVLSFVRTLSQKEAETFTKFCSLILNEENLGYFAFNPTGKEGLDEFGISYVDLIELDAYGLIRFDNNITGFTLNTNECIKFMYFGESFLFRVSSNMKKIRIPLILLTKLGQDLIDIASGEKNSIYLSKVISSLKKQGLEYTDDDSYIPTFLSREAD